MALINCPKCGAPYVSDKTFSCPHCTFNVKQYLDDKAKEEALEARRKREEAAAKEKAEKEAELKQRLEDMRKKEIEEEPLPIFPVPFLVGAIIAAVLAIVSLVVAQTAINVVITCVCLFITVGFFVFFMRNLKVYKEAQADPAKWKEEAYNARMNNLRNSDEPNPDTLEDDI